MVASFGVETFTANPHDAAQQTHTALTQALRNRAPVVLEIAYD